MYSRKIVNANRALLESRLGFALKEYSLPDVEDMEWRMKDIVWDADTSAPSRPLSEEEQRYIVSSLHLSKIDFRYWMQRYCKLQTDDKRLLPLIPWPSQELLLKVFEEEEEKIMAREGYAKIRAILLKSRQVGGTAISEALIAHMAFLNPRTQAVIGSDHPDPSLQLWQVLLRMYDNLPGWMKPHRDAKVKATNLHLDRIESDVVVGSGNQKTTLGQGMNIDAVHLTEVSTWDFPDYIDEDLMPAFNSSRKHHSFIVLESTGSGAKGNWFHDQFETARKGTSQFRPIFIAWYHRPGWRQSDEGMTFVQETLEMAERVKRESGYELDRRQLAFYQATRQDYESKDKLDKFYQEHPSTIEEAFQTGLRSVFSITLRSKVRDACKTPAAVYDVVLPAGKLRSVPLTEWIRSEDDGKSDNRLIIWELPKPGFLSVIGVDASYGRDGGDNSAIEVLRIGNKWAGDEQIAEWSGNLSPFDLAKIVEMVGKIYADPLDKLPAKVAVEVNPGSPGLVTQTELIRMGYPHFYTWKKPTRVGGGFTKEVGWWTTPSTRPLLIDMGIDYIKKGHLTVNSPFLVNEMGSFVDTGAIRPNGKRHIEHAPNYHDDRLIALFIALYVAHELDVVSMAEDRRKWQEQRSVPKESHREFQSMGITWEEAQRLWEESLAGG